MLFPYSEVVAWLTRSISGDISDVSVQALFFAGAKCSAFLKAGKLACAHFKIHISGFASGPELPPAMCSANWLPLETVTERGAEYLSSRHHLSAELLQASIKLMSLNHQFIDQHHRYVCSEIDFGHVV